MMTNGIDSLQRFARGASLLILLVLGGPMGAEGFRCRMTWSTGEDDSAGQPVSETTDAGQEQVAEVDEELAQLQAEIAARGDRRMRERQPGEWDTNDDGAIDRIVTVGPNGERIQKDLTNGVVFFIVTETDKRVVSETLFRGTEIVQRRAVTERDAPGSFNEVIDTAYFRDGTPRTMTVNRNDYARGVNVLESLKFNRTTSEWESLSRRETPFGQPEPTLMRQRRQAGVHKQACHYQEAADWSGGVLIRGPGHPGMKVLTTTDDHALGGRCTHKQASHFIRLYKEVTSRSHLDCLERVNRERYEKLDSELDSRHRNLIVMCGVCDTRGDTLVHDPPAVQVPYGINLNVLFGEFPDDPTEVELDKTAVFHELLHWATGERHKEANQGQPGRPEEGPAVDWINACGRHCGGCTTVDKVGGYSKPMEGDVTFDCARCAEGFEPAWECGDRFQQTVVEPTAGTQPYDAAVLTDTGGHSTCVPACMKLDTIDGQKVFLGDATPASKCARTALETCDRYKETDNPVPENVRLPHDGGLCATSCPGSYLLPEQAATLVDYETAGRGHQTGHMRRESPRGRPA